MPILGLNIDHVATVRQARRTYEPDPVWAAVEGQLAGAACITAHLREDRRHVQDDDVRRLKDVCQVKFNLEMAATRQMVTIARKLKPDMATLVPEGRQEVTTEGGLEIAGQLASFKRVVGQLKSAGIAASAFIDADPRQIEAAAKAGFEFCEIHTGPYAHAFHRHQGNLNNTSVQKHLKNITRAGEQITAAGMALNAGHALNYLNVLPIARLPQVQELHIGHAIISRALFVGVRQAASEMVTLIYGSEGKA